MAKLNSAPFTNMARRDKTDEWDMRTPDIGVAETKRGGKTVYYVAENLREGIKRPLEHTSRGQIKTYRDSQKAAKQALKLSAAKGE